MKVLHCIHTLRPETGGPARSVPALAAAQARAGAEVRLWIQEGASQSKSIPNGVKWQAELEFENWRPELIHDHGIWSPHHHQIANKARETGIPRVVSPRGMLEAWSMKHRRFKKLIAWWLYQRRDLKQADALHATANEEAERFRELGFLQPVICLPNGVDVPAKLPAREDKTGKDRVILFLSRIHPKKGLPMLIEAWSNLRRPGWRIRIIGPDENGHASELKTHIQKAGLQKSVSIEPPLNDAEKWNALVQSDLFVLPTYSENFGIVVAEALAAGIPVMTTTGTPWKQLEADGCGWCVEPNSKAIQVALESAIALTDLQRKTMGERGRAMVQTRYSWDAIARDMLKQYETLLTGRGLVASGS